MHYVLPCYFYLQIDDFSGRWYSRPIERIAMIINASENFRSDIEALPPLLRIALATHAAQRSIHRYRDWSLVEGQSFGKPEIVDKAILLCWSAIESNLEDLSSLQEDRQIIWSMIPQSEAYPDASGSGAMDSVCAVAYAADAVLNQGDVKFVIWAVRSALFAADYQIDHRTRLTDMSLKQEDQFEDERFTDLQYPLAQEYTHLKNVLAALKTWQLPTITRQQFEDLVSGL